MIDDAGLVNMNGRVYDPAIGRFLSADPFIQDVTNSQNLNRYSYVNNNPLSYTDPSGYFLKKLFKAIGRFFKKIWKPLVAIAAAILLQAHILAPLLGAAGVPSAAVPALSAGISGGVSNVILTGKPKAFLSGFGQAVATFGVGHGLFAKANVAFGSPGYFGKAVAHGVVGGAFAEIRGQSFSSGFLAAGFSSAAGAIAPYDRWGGTIFHAAAGGVGSVLDGGKFADGAVTGAFTYLFNDIAENARNGAHAERLARQQLQERGFEIVDLQVRVEVQRFSYTCRFFCFGQAPIRVYDVLVRMNGELTGIEVKFSASGVFRANKSQIEKDANVVRNGGVSRRYGVVYNVTYMLFSRTGRIDDSRIQAEFARHRIRYHRIIGSM